MALPQALAAPPSVETRGLRATDINGFQTGSSLEEVSVRVRLEHLGRGDFQAVQGNTKYVFGFTPLGRLYRIDSVQMLGHFAPDHATTRALTERLTAKFGAPKHNQLPKGPAAWSHHVPVLSADGRREMREAQSLSVMFQGGGTRPVELWIKLLDFRVLWEDAARLNAQPKAKAEEALRF